MKPSKKAAILVSQNDNQIFFNSMLNPVKPNIALLKAANRYKKLLL